VGTELRGKTLGVVGLGKIGREVIQRCRSFGMKIIGYDPYIDQRLFNPDEVLVTDLDRVTVESDFITLHVPLLDATRGLFDAERLGQMKPTAKIINVARGGIINESALASALKNGVISGAAIDVYSKEPIDGNHPLVGIPTCILTPHLGASTREAKEGVSIAVCEQIRDYLLHQKLTNALNLPVSDMSAMKGLEPYLECAEQIGAVQGQLVTSVIEKINVECFGELSEVKAIALAFLKGLLLQRTPDRINYINAESVAREQGISLEIHQRESLEPFSHVIRTLVTGDGVTSQIDGTVFGRRQVRFVNVLGYEMELIPSGQLTFVQNKDVPGVVGNIGSVIGKNSINISAYLLSRNQQTKEAFGIIRTEDPLSEEIIDTIRNMPEVLSVKQVDCTQ